MTVRSEATREFAKDVREGLSTKRKQLPSKYLYDSLGSRLFEAICQLPWYPITRAENRLLRSYSDQMVEPLGEPITLVELGCGSGEKISILAESMRGRGSFVMVHLIDISRTALEQSERTLGRLPYVSVVGHRATYEAGLRRAAGGRPTKGPLLVLFLGSNIGNFDMPGRHEFLGEIRQALQPGDALLLGTDLVKPEAELQLAYDDPIGVTSAFNKNMLARINRQLGGEFDLQTWDHRAVWNEPEARIEMHLVSRRRQIVRVASLEAEFSFEAFESIWTESSYKFTPEGVVVMGKNTGFRCHEQWIDPEGRFATTLLVAA